MHSKTIHTLSVEPGSRIAGRYEVRDRLGSGGMGVVYRCLDRDLGDVVALKLLHAHLAQDEEVFARFRNEVLVARALSHPNIVRLHDMGRAEEGFSYISMELVDGYSLHDRVVRRKTHPEMPTEPLTFQEALEILYQVCCGVAYAHDKGIIHRDLKPANVMISARGEVKLADFGTARIVGMDRSLTQAGQVIGTPDYMAPEQIRGEQLDASCDIYALGIIAYELAVGQKPYIAESAVAVAFKHLNEPIPAFANPAKGIPKWYEDVVRKATAKDRAERYPSAFEFAQALSDNAPELRNKSVLYMSEQRAATRSSKVPAHPVPPSKPSDSFYHLGEQAVAGGDSWVFGSYSPDAGLSSPPTPTTISMKRRSPFLKGLGMLVLFVLAFVASVRFVSTLNEAVSNKLPTWEKRWNVNLSAVSKLLGLQELPDSRLAVTFGDAGSSSEAGSSVTSFAATLSAGVTSSSSQASAPEIDFLEQQLLIEAGVSSPGTGTASSVSISAAVLVSPPASASESSSTPSSDSTISVLPIVSASASAASESSIVVRAESISSISSERVSTSDELFAASTLSGAIILSEERGGVAVSALDIGKLSRAQWRAVINGMPTGIPDAVLKKLVRENIRAQVVNAESGKLVGALELQIQKSPSPEQPALSVGGTISILRGADSLSPGAYRLELFRVNALIKAREFSLYRLAVAAPSGSAASAGVQVVTVPTYVPGADESQPTDKIGAEGPVTTQSPNVTIVTPPPPPPPIQFPQSSSVGWNSGGMLPPARRGAGELLPSQSQPGAVIPLPEQQSSVAPPMEPLPEIYQGRLSAEGGEELAEGRRLELRLTFNGADISGSASIEGLGEFAVDGKIYQRGVELNLRGTPSVRLSAGRRETTLRGRYNIPAEQKSGSWVATKR